MQCKTSVAALLAATGVLTVAACGPELTTPGETDLTGTWAAQQSFGVISEVRLTLVQGAGGSLSGSWIGNAVPPPTGCPPELGSRPTNVVTGTNTIAQVEFEMLGAGHFIGAVLHPTLLHGQILSCNVYFTLDFARLNE